ncbi:hypothetical protein KIPB_008536 [Kipferlia bialata]|uniref:Uncharacterized protein n=1 Tax=Kipferlia bialata TaxID=797122 RepID=A0A9K3D1Q7_9EUKA|nr:hypothetical protein KIPB_008536 [Kipferlia bialata]|eukprot:g8536.t1
MAEPRETPPMETQDLQSTSPRSEDDWKPKTASEIYGSYAQSFELRRRSTSPRALGERKAPTWHAPPPPENRPALTSSGNIPPPVPRMRPKKKV